MDDARKTALTGLALASRGRAGTHLLSRLEAAVGPISDWWPRRASHPPPEGALAPAFAAVLMEARWDRAAESALRGLASSGFAPDEGGDWPPFRALPDPPAVVYRRGRPFAEAPRLTVVGARAATAYGLRATRLLAGGAAAAGVAVVSGLARGVDSAAHESALEAGGWTIAVLGSGPDRPYPPENASLQERIGEAGTLLTEHPPGTPPRAAHFPRRNRLLAALGDAVLLVEARVRSGSLTTVRWAADLGRDVLVVPGPIDAPLSEGSLTLLREGAVAVGAVDHVLSALGMATEAGSTARAARADLVAGDLSASEERLIALVRGAPTDLDELVRLSCDAPSVVLTSLLALESRGLVVREADGRSFRAP